VETLWYQQNPNALNVLISRQKLIFMTTAVQMWTRKTKIKISEDAAAFGNNQGSFFCHPL